MLLGLLLGLFVFLSVAEFGGSRGTGSAAAQRGHGGLPLQHAVADVQSVAAQGPRARPRLRRRRRRRPPAFRGEPSGVAPSFTCRSIGQPLHWPGVVFFNGDI